MYHLALARLQQRWMRLPFVNMSCTYTTVLTVERRDQQVSNIAPETPRCTYENAINCSIFDCLRGYE